MPKSGASSSNIKIIAENRKAYHDYHILDRYEAGMELFGTEVKSLRESKVNLKDSYALFRKGEIFVSGMHISVYKQGNRFNHDPDRDRKLLMHRAEIDRLYGRVKEEGLTLVPTKIYFSRGKVKLEIALAKGKKAFDKREALKKKDAERSIRSRLKREI